jgi:hypothetical protein
VDPPSALTRISGGTVSPLRNRSMGGSGLLVVMDPRQD